MRGNPDHRRSLLQRDGSIPAHAGEPRPRWPLSASTGVYPRACGGTSLSRAPCSPSPGLSPRMRGNLTSKSIPPILMGSIPAHAGEPPRRRRARPPDRVYPRACGGTNKTHASESVPLGLSPRMRGNRSDRVERGGHDGSIPAHAGEPPVFSLVATAERVYPRACGGTPGISTGLRRSQGLSPRMRGNRDLPAAPRADRGSIPAHAGEPFSARTETSRSRVYPRACGGTGQIFAFAEACKGLSPRMRGNLDERQRNHPAKGSIPAHAGEPYRSGRTGQHSGVYPRACGGTEIGQLRLFRNQGLSPRMRGNQDRKGELPGSPGSIPAHAGEPLL